MSFKKICVIPARAGSKGVPGKNSRLLGGEPLVVWTIQAAISSSCFDKIIVSSDCPKIKRICSSFDVEFDQRPLELGNDDVHASSVVIDVVKRFYHTLESRPDVVAMLLPTSPFRTSDQIKLAAEMIDDNKCESVVGVIRTGKYLNNIRIFKNENLSPIVSSNDLNAQRQSQEEVLFVNGAIFFAKTETLLVKKTFHVLPCLPFEMDKTTSIDINSEEDFNDAERAILES